MWNSAPGSWRCSFGEPWGAFNSRPFTILGQAEWSAILPAFAWADKLAFVLTPAWLYLPMARGDG